jgi:hypothetical protein
VTEITHRTVETNGVRIHLAEAGQGPLVLMCHGLWLARCFRQHAEMVKESLRCSCALRATRLRREGCRPEKSGRHHGTARAGGWFKIIDRLRCGRWASFASVVANYRNGVSRVGRRLSRERRGSPWVRSGRLG